VVRAEIEFHRRMRIPIGLTPCLEAAATKPIESPREPLGPPVKFRDRVTSAVPKRDTGRPDLPVIKPGESPRRIARRLV
jgi:hypothetical protein